MTLPNQTPTVRVFISYARNERDLALRLRRELESRGIEVTMDDNFEPGTSVMVNFGRAINNNIVLSIISTDYLDRYYTGIEVSAVMTSRDGQMIPVVIGRKPEPRTSDGQDLWTVVKGRTYFELDMTPKRLDDLVEEIRAKRPADVVSIESSVQETDQAIELIIIHDWEDEHLVDDVVEQLQVRGLAAIVDSASAGVAAGLTDEQVRATIGVLWTEPAQASPDVSGALLHAVAGQRDVIYLLDQDGPSPPGGARTISLRAPRASRGDTPERHSGRWIREPTILRASLEASLNLNGSIPFHLLGDRFCASRESAAAAQSVYEMAVYGAPARDENRLGAVLAYAAVLRFRGGWKLAADVLGREPLPESSTGNPRSSTALAISAERLSLDFEFGNMSEIVDRAGTILSQARALGDWPLIIAAHRQLGMLTEERGEYSVARDHLGRAAHYAEDLLDGPILVERIASRDARVALWADCLRELAALEWRTGDTGLALQHLDRASESLEGPAGKSAADYLRNVIQYQRTTIQYSADHDYELAKPKLEDSYRALQKYANPMRLATVLEALVRLEMDFIRKRDDKTSKLRPTLEKILRVRQMRGHDFMIARTIRTLGDLEFALGNLPSAIAHYESARDEFNRLGKAPEMAGALRSLSRCHSRLGDTEEAITQLEDALGQLREPDHHDTCSEIRSEIAKLRHRRIMPDQIDPATEMADVGEYTLHRWIAQGLVSQPGRRNADIVVGVGDDAAVLRAIDDHDLLVTTDTVPPSLLVSNEPAAAAYAARFAVVSSLADIVAMGGEPMALLLNLHLRRGTTASWARSLIQKVAEEASVYGAAVVGGDLKERDQKALTVSAIGKVRRGHALTRNDARAGDLIVLTLSSGLDQPFTGLGARWAHALVPQLSRHEQELIKNLTAEDARYTGLSLPLDTMRAISSARLATAAIDTSDGILGCAQLLGEASNVGVELFAEKLDELIHQDVQELALSLGIAPFLFALNTGYDWEIMLTVPQSDIARLEALAPPDAASRYPRVAVIGQVVGRSSWSEDGVRVRDRSDAAMILPFFTDEKFVPRPYGLRAREWLDFAREGTRRLRPDVAGMDSP